MYRFNWRTAKPLTPCSALGCDKPTSRCQSTSSIGTLRRYQPVIPNVPFICCAITCPQSIIGSLQPTLIPVQLIQFYSQADIYYYTQSFININQNLPYAYPRYSLEGHRPSQTDLDTLLIYYYFINIAGSYTRMIFHLGSHKNY